MTTNQESIMPTKIITKSKTQQAIETYMAYPNTAPEDVAEMLGITEAAARHCKRIADGETPSIRGASKYRAVREYIISHPRASVDRIAKACACSRTYVMQLLNPTSGSIAAEFGDIRKNHIKRGNIKKLPLSVPPLKNKDVTIINPQHEMINLLRKDNLNAEDLKALGSLFLTLSNLMRGA